MMMATASGRTGRFLEAAGHEYGESFMDKLRREALAPRRSILLACCAEAGCRRSCYRPVLLGVGLGWRDDVRVSPCRERQGKEGVYEKK